MTSQTRKQIQNLCDKINSKYQEWESEMDWWANHQELDRPVPNLGKMIEDLLFHLRGLDEKKAGEFEWMMIV